MKYHGNIGFLITEETVPGVWEEHYIVHPYSGDVLRFSSQQSPSSEKLTDDISIKNRISIIADPFALGNFYNIRYIEWLGAKWKVTDADVDYPRIILSIGGLYNESNPSS